MGIKQQSSSPPPPELEETADYPPVSATAPADTWVMPQLASAPVIDDVVRAHQEEIGTLRQDLAAVTASRDQLEVTSSGLSARLRELEQLLRDKSEQHSHYEHDLGERDRRSADLAQDLAARDEQLRLGVAERDELRAQLERAQAELTGIARLRERQTGAQAEAERERERARREAALARSQDDLTDLQRRVAGHREALQRAEGRRQVFDAMLREREQMLDERDARWRALQEEFTAHRREATAALARSAAELAASQARAAEAERQLAQQLQHAQARQQQLTATAAAAPGPDPESQSRIAALEAQIADHNEALGSLREQLDGALAANETLRGDLVAAEQLLHSAEGESQYSKAQLARLEEQVAGTAAQSPPARTRLLVRTDGDVGIVHVLGRRTTIGRTPDNDLRIDTDFISRHHAVVLVSDNGTIVEDLNSTNGVFINKLRIARHDLKEGDLLTIGNTSFRYVLKPPTDQD